MKDKAHSQLGVQIVRHADHSVFYPVVLPSASQLQKSCSLNGCNFKCGLGLEQGPPSLVTTIG